MCEFKPKMIGCRQQTNNRRQLQRVVKKSNRHLGTLSSLLQQSLHLASQRHCKQSINTVVVELMCDNCMVIVCSFPSFHYYIVTHSCTLGESMQLFCFIIIGFLATRKFLDNLLGDLPVVSAVSSLWYRKLVLLSTPHY